MPDDYCVILTTVGSKEEADSICRAIGRPQTRSLRSDRARSQVFTFGMANCARMPNICC